MNLTNFVTQVGFWASWLLIPLIFEFIPAMYGFFTLQLESRKLKRNHKKIKKLPRISLIIPVYNSASTLFNCIKSVNESSYPNKLIKIIIANNQSTDQSFNEYRRARNQFNDLLIQWINTTKGKARALNSAIYKSDGKYIINIDSDGTLQKEALLNMVTNFELNPSVDAQTGTILTQKNSIRTTNHHVLKFLRRNEYLEYAQSFLAGRAIESAHNRLFTMSGAFSAFRRDKLLQTKLYNIETVGEDIDMTFQIRYYLNGKVMLCPQAIFYVEPLDNFSKLYTQRQRWQRGELETIHSFMTKSKLSLWHFSSNFLVRRLLMDHTILFLRVISTIALIATLFSGSSQKVVGFSFLILYALYVLICFLNFIEIQYYLKAFPSERKFYLSQFYILLTLPLYYMLCSFIQFIGIINSMTVTATWKASTPREEEIRFISIIKKDLRRPFKGYYDK